MGCAGSKGTEVKEATKPAAAPAAAPAPALFVVHACSLVDFGNVPRERVWAVNVDGTKAGAPKP